MIYREATLEDMAQLLVLEQSVIEAERPFNQAIKAEQTHYYDLQRLITEDDSLVMVAECGGVIVATGYVDIRHSKESLSHSRHGYLGFMFVEPGRRGEGINQQIIDRLIDWSRRQGIRDFYLDVYAQNSPAIRAYEKAGFTSSMVEMKLSLAQDSA